MFEGLERITLSEDWITIILLLVLTLITLIKINYNDRFTKLFSLLYSDKYYTDYSKTNPLLFNVFHFLFILVVILNISLVIFNSFVVLKPLDFEYGFSFFLRINLVVILYFFIRYILGYIIAYIFDENDKQKYFTFLKISNLSLISILLYPLLILVNYSVGLFHNFLIIFSIITIIILFFLRYFTLVKKEKTTFNSLFYLFLYLCALEIAPFIVIYKAFVD
ncbi:MAG: DUF4271 domain-containing protein [Flavobacteriaceae bacterium]|nr:DUF4271 domain-containing protein [Flavobacteriaceae bacterium]